MPPSDPLFRPVMASDAEHFRKRAVFLLHQLTGVDLLDPRLRELVECIEAAAVAVVDKRLQSKSAP